MSEVMEKLETIETLIQKLFISGGQAAGERIETAAGYIVGRKKDGEPCLWVYGHDRLEFKIATIWAEDFDKLGFKPDLSVQFPVAQAPSRGEAASGQYWRAWSAELVMVPTGEMSDKGNPKYRFSHVAGTSPASDPAPATSVDRSAARLQAVKAGSLDQWGGSAYALFGDVFSSPAGIVKFAKRIAQVDKPSHVGLLVAAEAYAARMAFDGDQKKALAAAEAVYQAMF